jgi:putative transposase
MHRTLKQETLCPPARNPRLQQQAFHRFQKTYNDERPHEALSYRTPASGYQRSLRPFPRCVPEVQYDSGVAVRRISDKGDLKFQGACSSARFSVVSGWACREPRDSYTNEMARAMLLE